MALRFAHPEWLWAALAALPCVLIAARWFNAMSTARRWTSILARVALIVLLAALLARPTIVRLTDRLTVVAVVDVSDSVRRLPQPPGMLDRVQAALDRATLARGPEDLAAVVVFDGSAVTVSTPTLADVSQRSIDLHGSDGTNLADAISLAAALIPADAAGRLLLMSDGNQTTGDALAAARRLARTSATGVRRGVPIDVVPIDYDVKNEVLVESVDAPPRAAARATVSVRVTLLATAPARGQLRLLHNDLPIDANGVAPGLARPVQLKPGRNFEVIEVPLGPERIHRFKAIFEPESVQSPDPSAALGLIGDTLIENNSGESFTITPGQGRVLIADGIGDGRANGPGSTLANALNEAGLDADLVPTTGIPEDLLKLQEYDLVVLQNVPADAVSERSQRTLITHVRDLGGGLIVTGGRDSFGAGGWRGTPLEPLLPVKLELPDKLVVPESSVIFVIDNSGSMGHQVMGSGRSQQEIADEAVALAIRSLDKNDLVGVISFTDDAQVVVPFEKNSDPAGSADKVRDISPGGGTNMLPALQEARKSMRRVEAKSKHVIVLSDGRSQNEPQLPGFAGEMAREGVKVSSIAVGDAAHLESMRLIAERGGGVYYQVIDPQVLPRVFLKAVRVVRTPMIREVPFIPILTSTGSPLTAGLTSATPTLPVLGGLSLTQARNEPTITLAMVTPDGEPVLAHWAVELGQVAAFTSDVGGEKGGWSAAWIASPTYRQFWLQAVRVLARANVARGLAGRVDAAGGRLHLSLEAMGDDGQAIDRLRVPATVYGPGGQVINVTLNQTGPGVYETWAETSSTTRTLAGRGEQSGSWIAVIKPSDADKRLTPVLAGASVSSSIETRALTSNRALMEEIAASTGGRVLTLDSLTRDLLYDRSALSPQEATTPLWHDLLLWVIVAVLVDIATRRIAWDRWVSREFGVELKTAAAESVYDRGTQVGASLSGLKGKLNDPPNEFAPSSPAPLLTERDAESLARAQADRRRAARLAALRDHSIGVPQSRPERPEPTREASPEHAPDLGSLSAAKRRARAKFDEDDVREKSPNE